MPYLRIFLKQDLNEAEAQLALVYVRDHFPLRQSEGRLLRVASAFVLFEQPEHEVLTLEQELWLEKHAQEAHIEQTWFYHDTTEGCRACNHPFDESPTGYCLQCHHVNPFQIASLQLPLVEAEDAYLGTLAHQICGRRQNTGSGSCEKDSPIKIVAMEKE